MEGCAGVLDSTITKEPPQGSAISKGNPGANKRERNRKRLDDWVHIRSEERGAGPTLEDLWGREEEGKAECDACEPNPSEDATPEYAQMHSEEDKDQNMAMSTSKTYMYDERNMDIQELPASKSAEG